MSEGTISLCSMYENVSEKSAKFKDKARLCLIRNSDRFQEKFIQHEFQCGVRVAWKIVNGCVPALQYLSECKKTEEPTNLSNIGNVVDRIEEPVVSYRKKERVKIEALSHKDTHLDDPDCQQDSKVQKNESKYAKTNVALILIQTDFILMQIDLVEKEVSLFVQCNRSLTLMYCVD